MSQSILKVKNATKNFSIDKSIRGIKDATFEVEKGEIVCVLGSSGSGKSTLLRTLAGVEKLDKGAVMIDRNVLASYVSQEYTLWPHLTVMQNLTLAPSLNGADKKAIRAEAEQLLQRFDLSAYANIYPDELSGGQRQRVALLRAVMMKPEILLLDEITSALDPELTKSVLDLIRALAKDGYTMIIVTHHMSFAMSVADRVLFLKKGKITQDVQSDHFFVNQSDPEIKSFIMDIAKQDESVEVFRGTEQFQAYHLGLMKRLPEKSVIYICGGAGDAWYAPMEEFYPLYEKLRKKKKIKWKSLTYIQNDEDRRLLKEQSELNEYKEMPRSIQNPANYNVFGDTVITQIFEDEPTIIQIKNQNTADAYMRFFEELWNIAK